MIDVLGLDKAQEWDKLVRRYPDHDVYYLSGYTRAFSRHGDGAPRLFHYKDGGNEAVCVLMVRDVAEDPRFRGRLAPGTVFDAVTPYGYGGFIFMREPDAPTLARLKDELRGALRGAGIISAFFRFHPLAANAEYSRPLMEVTDLGLTVAMDLSDEETIWANITSKNRNMIRKAQKSGITITHSDDRALFEDFRRIYNATMERDGAEPYYYFAPSFYDEIAAGLPGHWQMFSAVKDGAPVAMSIMLGANSQMGYHLSGSLAECRSLAPTNLLLYEAALWGSRHGYRTLHLGGGVGSGQDNLYKFKAAFYRGAGHRFSIGRLITDPDAYRRLVQIRRADPAFDASSRYFPLYRAD